MNFTLESTVFVLLAAVYSIVGQLTIIDWFLAKVTMDARTKTVLAFVLGLVAVAITLLIAGFVNL